METKQIVLCALLLFPALLVVGLIWLEAQNFRLRFWRQTNGRIVASHNEAREIRSIEHSTLGSSGQTHSVAQETLETRNFAALRYEFQVAGQTYQGSRVDLAVDGGNFEVAETLSRYPAGKIVPVYYDRRDPNHCVLERLDPSRLRAGWFAVVVLVAVIFAGVYGVDRFADFARTAIPRPDNVPFVIFLAIFALVVMRFAYLLGQKGRTMSAWPQTSGEIVESMVAETTRRDDGPSHTDFQTMYTPRVVFAYVVDGMSFQGDNVGAILSSGNPAGPTKFIARFPLKTKVTVFYNPAVPTESTLTTSVGYAPVFLWTLAAAFAFAALATAGYVPHL
jgi:hypothetical protein